MTKYKKSGHVLYKNSFQKYSDSFIILTEGVIKAYLINSSYPRIQKQKSSLLKMNRTLSIGINCFDEELSKMKVLKY